jgi:dsDNA-specific endonuclease/ATPase MutS2
MLSQCAQEIENFNMLKDGERQALDLAKLSGLNFKSLSEIANSLEGQDKKDVEDMINSINKTDKALKNTLCKRGV